MIISIKKAFEEHHAQLRILQNKLNKDERALLMFSFWQLEKAIQQKFKDISEDLRDVSQEIKQIENNLSE